MSEEFNSDYNEEDIEKQEAEEAIIQRENFEKNLKNIWGYTQKGLEAKKAAMSMLATKNGMYARIPLMCKAENCPYANKCSLLPYNLAPYGEACPIETAQIELRYAAYEKDFDLDESSFTDKNLVSELINHDIMLERCKALLSEEGVLVQDVFAGVSEEGEVFTRPEVSKHWEAYERISKKRNEIYDLMMATRKNKKSLNNNDEEESVSKMVSEMVGDGDFIIEDTPNEFIDINPMDHV